MRTVKFATLVIVASATFVACKPKEEEAPAPVAEVTEEAPTAEEAAAVAEADRREACNLNSSAPESHDWTTYWEPGGGENGAKSVHWANATEKEAQAANFRASALEITCSSSESPSVSVTLSASNSTEEDVPMAPGSYPIAGRQQPAVKGRQFLTMSLTYDGRTFDSRSGTFSISEFTSSGVTGTFTIEGAEMNTEEGAPIRIQGSFTFPCRAGLMQSECTANQD
jgi:hypothetical protein